MTTVEDLVNELLKCPMCAYIAVGCNLFDDIEISIRHFESDKIIEEFDYISLD